jgi:pyruvate kinase
MRRTKIVATLGPASYDRKVVERLIQSGTDVIRLNFSHGTKEQHQKGLETVREVSKRLGRAVACLQDLSGPKIRTGTVSAKEGVLLEDGASFTLTTEKSVGNAERVSTSYSLLPQDVGPGKRILLDDGLIELEVEEISGGDVRTRVVSGGRLKSKKGINLPGVSLSIPSLTKKDREDMDFGLSLDVDFVAQSFVRSRSDVEELRAYLTQRGRPDLPVIAKIEKPDAVGNLPSILNVADGVMVARGDLGVELPTEQIPTLQKEIIRAANERGRVVITATQMLESMVEQPRPTRAEATDVANAILDGTDALMLSAETAIGNYPVESVATMARIAEYTERRLGPRRRRSDFAALEGSPVARAVAVAACRAAEQLDARYVVAFTESGSTARLVSYCRPASTILAFTPHERVYRQLALTWGATPMKSRHYETTDEMLESCMKLLSAHDLVVPEDIAIVVCGTTTLEGATNMMKIYRF